MVVPGWCGGCRKVLLYYTFVLHIYSDPKQQMVTLPPIYVTPPPYKPLAPSNPQDKKKHRHYSDPKVHALNLNRDRTTTPGATIPRVQLPPRTTTPQANYPPGQIPPRTITPVGQLPPRTITPIARTTTSKQERRKDFFKGGSF